MLARDMRRDNDYLPIAFVDDQRRLRGAKVHGIPVMGTIDELPALANQLASDIAVIAIPSASAGEMRRVVERCEQARLPFRTLPRLDDLMVEHASVLELRDVAIEDLLGRAPISLDWRQISSALVGKTVLVTGAGGSIGSELCRQIARVGPTQLVIFERCEFNLYSIELELRRSFPELLMSAHLGDITAPAAVEYVFNAGRGHGEGRRDLRARHWTADEYPLSRRATHPALGQGGRQGDRHRLHRAATGRKALRRANLCAGEAQQD